MDFDPRSPDFAPLDLDLAVDLSPDSEERRLLLKTLATGTLLTLGAGAPLTAMARQRVRFHGRSTPLQMKVNAYIQKQRRLGRIAKDESTSWSVYDFRTGRKLVAINEDAPRQAASMIKPFVVAAFFYTEKKRGSGLRYNRKARHLMELSIRRSNNWATNQLMKDVIRHSGSRGPRDVERVLKRNAPAIFQNTRIVETIPAGGRTYRNKASAHDYSRFLYALWKNKLPRSDEIRELMALPNRDRISGHTIPSHTPIYDKTGTTARLCGNMGIIEARGRNGKRYPYTFVGIIEKRSRTRHYNRWAKNRSKIVREVSAIVYNELKRQHHLA